jgi:DNA-binding response OmpR family regulator
VVDHADNGLTGYHLAMTAEYDMLILDIMLPACEWLGYYPRCFVRAV